MGYLIRHILLLLCLFAVLTTNIPWKNIFFVVIILLIFANQSRETWRNINEKPEGDYLLRIKRSKPKWLFFFLLYAALSFYSFKKGNSEGLYIFILFILLSLFVIIHNILLARYKVVAYILRTSTIVVNSIRKPEYYIDLLYAIRLNDFTRKLSFHFQGEKEIEISTTDYDESAVLEFVSRVKDKCQQPLEVSENLEALLEKKQQ